MASVLSVDEPRALVASVIATSELERRPRRVPDYRAQSRALARLAAALSDESDTIAQLLVDAVKELTGAESAGLSLQEGMQSPEPQFRWVATAGEFGRYLGATLPRYFSPCGEVLGCNEAILMDDPARAYPYIADLHVPCREVLLVPFHSEDTPIGTLWAVFHSPDRHFDVEDRRVMESLSVFASAAVRTSGMLGNLRRADRMKDEFIATLGHELRNPLSPLKVAVQVLRRSSSPEEQQRMLDIVERQSTHLTALVEDLLDVAAIRSGKITLRLGETSMHDVVARALEATRAGLDQKQHRLSVELASEPIIVEGDLLRLTQVVVNLLGNASKYTPQGGSIRLMLALEGERAVLRVADDGIGIAADVLPRVFDMFVQGQRTRSTAQGLGIGLALVQQIVQLHGGGVEAASAGKDRGSCFTVWLPSRRNDAPA